MRKFANLAPKSLRESILCMQSGHEKHKAHVTNSRSYAHRMVEKLWKTTRSSVKDVRFYSVMTSCCLLFSMVVFMVAAVAYVLMFTVYLKDSGAYHWLLWTSSMLLFFHFHG